MNAVYVHVYCTLYSTAIGYLYTTLLQSKLKGRGEGGEKCYHTVEPHLWNDFVEKALESRGGSITLSSSLGVMCDGVRVLYGGSGEGDGEGREEGFVSLEELHKKVWSHSEFLDVMNSSPVDPDNVGSAKGTCK